MFSLLLVSPSYVSVLRGKKDTMDIIVTLFAACCLSLLGVYAFTGLLGSFASSAYTDNNLLVMFVLLVLIISITFCVKIFNRQAVIRVILSTAVIVCFAAAVKLPALAKA